MSAAVLSFPRRAEAAWMGRYDFEKVSYNGEPAWIVKAVYDYGEPVLLGAAASEEEARRIALMHLPARRDDA